MELKVCLLYLFNIKVYVRRPTGNTSWIMRIENGGALLPTTQDFPLADVSSLLLRNRDLDLDLDVDRTELDDSDQEMMLEAEGGEERGAEPDDQEKEDGCGNPKTDVKQQGKWVFHLYLSRLYLIRLYLSRLYLSHLT